MEQVQITDSAGPCETFCARTRQVSTHNVKLPQLFRTLVQQLLTQKFTLCVRPHTRFTGFRHRQRNFEILGKSVNPTPNTDTLENAIEPFTFCIHEVSQHQITVETGTMRFPTKLNSEHCLFSTLR